MKNKTALPQDSLSKLVTGKTLLLTIAILICFAPNLSAGIKPTVKHRGDDKTASKGKGNYNTILTTDKDVHGSVLKPSGAFGLPLVNYTGPQTYVAGIPITPLSPAHGGVAAPGYSSSTTTLGSGFNIPAGVALDAQGNIYIGDQNNNQVKMIPVGSNTPVVIATGFSTPDGVAVDAAGNVYVADDGNNLIKVIPFTGGAYGAPVVIGASYTFSQPFDVAVDNKGNVYVADRGHNAVVEIPVGGAAPFTIGSGFSTPTGVAVDSLGNVYVADNGNSAIKKIPAGNGTPVTLGSGFANPFTPAVDGSGNVFVADYGNKLVKEIPANGGPIITLGSGYSFIFGTAVDINNNVYVTDYGNNAVKKIQPTGGYYINPALPLGLIFNNTTGTISGTPVAASPATNYTVTAYNINGSNSTTINIAVVAVAMSYVSPQTYTAGTAITPLAPTGGGAAAPGYSTSTTTLGSGFNIPAGIAVDAAGNVYIGDQNNNVVKKIPGGTGIPIVIASGFSTPDGVAIDAAGNVYVADDGNNLVKEIPFTGGTYGAPVVIGASYTFSQPFDVAVDLQGNVYVADRGHNAVVEIPVGGSAPFTIGSGFATPTGVAVDAYGNVYVADNGHSAIKEILTTGTVITLGSGFANPFTPAVDGSGNVFVADYGNKLVKEIPVNGGAIATVGSGYSFIFGVTTDALNNVYVTDYGNNAVKKIQPTGGYYINPALPLGLSFNNTTGAISGTPIAATPATNYMVTAYNQYGGNSTTINITVNAVTMSYASPKIYVAGTTITPLAPTGGGAAAPAYSTSTTTLGSGFNIPAGIAVDAAGNVYIGDQNNNVVKKIPGGTGIPIVIGTGFSTPDGIAIDAQGNVYVANDGGNTVQEIPYTSGTYGTPITLGGGFTFLQPFDVAVDNKGNVYVADRGNNAVEEIPVGGGATFAIGSGFATPTGVAVDAYGNVYVADNGHSAIKEILTTGTVITLGSGFANPFTPAVDGSGNVFVADYGNKLVKEIPVNGGAITTVGSGYSFIFGVTTDALNNVYVTDYGNNAVKKIQPTGGYYINPALPLGLSFNNTTGAISGTPIAASPATNYTVTAYNQYGYNSATINITVNAVTMSYAGPKTYAAGTTITPLSPTGGGAAAPAYSTSTTTLGSGFNIPAGIAVDAAGNVYIGDQNNNVVKKIPGGTGTPIVIGTGFSTPDGIAIDAQGNVYVANDGGNTVQEIPCTSGTYGTPITLGGGFTFLQPFDVAVDTKGNVYVADRGNNAVEEIPVGGGATFAIGSGFATPTGVAVDAYGNVYVADNGHSAIKEILTTGTVITLGSGFANPFTPAVDGSGNVFVADYGNKLVKEIPVNGGAITTVGSGYSFIFGVTTDALNNVYVTDYGNNAVKKIQPTGGYYINPALPLGLSFNNTTGAISGTPIAASPATNYTVTAYNQYGYNSATINITVNAVTMTYASPKTFVVGTPITHLIPTGGGAAAPAYSTSTTTLGSGFNIPAGIAVDAAGNIYIGDQNNNAVKKIPGGTGTPIVIASGFSTPDGVALDAAGNVYVADDGNNLVKEIPFTGGTYGAPVVIGASYTFSQPFDVAVDSKGNVYVADRGHNAVVEIPVGGATPFTIGSGFATPTGVATDAYGNVYVADNGHSAIKEIPAGNGTPITLGSGFSNPFTPAVDGSGNVFVADYGNKQVKEIPINGGPILTIGSGYSFIFGVTTDIFNNVYVTDYGNNAVKKIQPIGGYYINPALPLGLNFNNSTGIISGTPAAVSPATNYTITSYNGFGGNSTIVNLKVTDNTSLSALALSNGTLSPAFGPNTLNYTASVPNEITSTTITPAAVDPAATILVNGIIVTSGSASQSLPLSAGANPLTTKVISQDGTFSQSYTVTLTRAPFSSNATLSSIGSSITPLTPVFNSNITSYTLNVNNATASMTVTPVATNGNATIKVNGTTVASGATSGALALAEGTTTAVNVVVTSFDGTTIKTYTIMVTRAPSSNALLTSMGPSIGPLTPVFTSGTTSYTLNVTNATATMTVKPVSADANAMITVNGVAVSSGSISGHIALAEGGTTPITVMVTAQDGSTTKTYTIMVTRPVSTNAGLSNIQLSNGTLSPVFATATTSYTANVPNSISSITLTPTTIDTNAMVMVNGMAVITGEASPSITLAEGTNTAISVVVTAQDGTTIKTYTVTVTRAPSSDATLSSIGPKYGPLTPVFSSGVTSYALSVSNSTATMTVQPVSSDANATIKVNGTTVASGVTSGLINLAEGTVTPINVAVTAQDGTTVLTYTINVTRGPSSVATLSSLGPQYGPLTPVFASGTTSYTLNVSNSITSITVKPVATDANATIKVNGTTLASGTTSAHIPLAVGNNTITTAVTAQNGTNIKTYTLTVTRASGGADSFDPGISVTKPTETPALAADGILVHQAISPNGDGMNDFLQIDNISQYPDNKLAIMNRNGQLVYEAKGYDNSSKVFDGHSNKNGQMQLPGTYFYQLDYTVNGIARHKTGFIVLKY